MAAILKTVFLNVLSSIWRFVFDSNLAICSDNGTWKSYYMNNDGQDIWQHIATLGHNGTQ